MPAIDTESIGYQLKRVYPDRRRRRITDLLGPNRMANQGGPLVLEADRMSRLTKRAAKSTLRGRYI